MNAQNALIAGTSSGFGFATAQDLGRNGYHVYATMRNISSANSEATEQLRSFAVDHGVHLSVYELDTNSDNSVNTAVEGILQGAGHVDVPVNNAGVMPLGISEAFTADQFASCLNTNVVGYCRTMKAVVPSMRARQSGLIINIGSVSGRIAFRYELSSVGINVVIVEPGPFETTFVNNSPSPEDETIITSYGDTPANVVQTIEDSFVKLVSEQHLPTDPKVVVDSIRQINETPVGDRPLRVTVGPDFHVSSMNDARAPHQLAAMQQR